MTMLPLDGYKDVLDPENPDASLSVDELTSIPHPLQTLVDAGFRALRWSPGTVYVQHQ
jgi:regulator of chromosome condensation